MKTIKLNLSDAQDVKNAIVSLQDRKLKVKTNDKTYTGYNQGLTMETIGIYDCKQYECLKLKSKFNYILPIESILGITLVIE
jgi:hypothetical protein